ncbi:MAG: flavin monoamine oxidase family protein [Telluria sp.]
MSNVSRPASLAIPASPRIQDGDDFDVLVVGAGMSGLYTAWRMRNDYQRSPRLAALAARRPDGRLRIGVLEYSDRVGGRLDSVILDNMQNVPAELGGMRFTKSHELVNVLVDELGLRSQIDEFPMTQNSQFTLRATRLSETAIQEGEPVPYKLAPDEQKLTPNQLFNYAIEQVVGKDALTWSDANWQWIKQNFKYTGGVYDNQPLYDIGFWNVLYEVVSNEGYDFCWDGGGYNSNTINWNAAEAMPYMLTDFSVTPNYMRFKTGFHTLPATLAERVLDGGTPIFANTQLVRFDRLASGSLAVQAQRTGDPATRVTVSAAELVLAMPRHSLELLDQDTPFFREQATQYNIQSVLLQPAYKLFMAYENRWWDQALFYSGPTITDMPLRMTYDFGTEEERGGQPGDGRALLLASYCDMNGASFWSVLERRTTYTEPPSWDKTGSKGGAPAPDIMCDMAEQMLVKVFSVGGVEPKPSRRIGSYYQDWSQDPYGAGFHAWAAHYKAWEIMRTVRQPLADWPVYICGEAYSNAQGWVEGAVCTAESVLEDKFGMPRIPGLSPLYPLLTPPPVKPGDEEARPTFLRRDTNNAF